MCDICKQFEGDDPENNPILDMLKKKHAKEGQEEKKNPFAVDLGDSKADPLIMLDKINAALLAKIDREFWFTDPPSLTLLKLRKHALEGSITLVELRIKVMEESAKQEKKG